MGDLHGILGRYTSFEEMNGQEKPRVVNILTSPPTHVDIATEVLKRASDVNVSEIYANTNEEVSNRLCNVTVASDQYMGVMTLGDHTNFGQLLVELFTPLMVIRLNMSDLT